MADAVQPARRSQPLPSQWPVAIGALPAISYGVGAMIAAVIGGLLPGVGARMAYGCNIGAFFSGVASFSLHGWIWILFALPGNWVGVQLRPLFGLET